MRRDAITRRSLLASAIVATAAVGLAGCQGERWYPPTVTPDGSLLRAVIAEKERMVERYTAAVAAAGPDTANLLEGLLDQHRRQLEVLRERLPPNEGNGPVADEGAGASPAPGDPPSLTVLGAAEQAAAARRARQSAQAEDASLAQLLASVGAREAGHAYLLR